MNTATPKPGHAPDKNGVYRHRPSHKDYKRKTHIGWYELAHKIHRESGVQLYIVRNIVGQFLDEISKALAAGESVELRNLFTFTIVLKDARLARDPYIPGSSFVVPPRAAVRTRVSRNLKVKVKALTPALARKSHEKMDSTPEYPIA